MRTKKAFKNITVSMLYQVVSIICGLITPRLILANFGSTYNGVINSATHFLGMISFLTLGIAGSTRVALYKTLANNDVLGTSRIMKATKNYMRKVACCVLVYAALLMLIYPFISHNDLSKGEMALLIGIISVGTFADYFLAVSNRTLLTADQSGYITYGLQICTTVLNTVITAVLIYLGANIFNVKFGSAIVYFVLPLVLNFYVAHKYSLISDCEPDYSAIKDRGAVAFHSIANIVHNNTDLFVLTIFTDAKVISVYTVYYLVVGKIKSIMQIFTNGMEAAFGDMWVKGEVEKLRKNFRVYEYALYCFTAVVFSCVGLLILPFLQRYTKGVTDINYIRLDLAVLITAAEGMHGIRQPYLTLVQATGNYEATKKGAAFEAINNIVLSLLLVPVMGIGGVIVGTLVANIIRTTQFSWFVSKNILKESYKKTVLRFGWLLLCMSIIVVMHLATISRIEFNPGWIGWIQNACITFGMALVVTMLFSVIFYKSEFSLLFGVAKKMLRR